VVGLSNLDTVFLLGRMEIIVVFTEQSCLKVGLHGG